MLLLSYKHLTLMIIFQVLLAMPFAAIYQIPSFSLYGCILKHCQLYKFAFKNEFLNKILIHVANYLTSSYHFVYITNSFPILDISVDFFCISGICNVLPIILR